MKKKTKKVAKRKVAKKKKGSNIFVWLERQTTKMSRYVLVKVKEWRGHKGPLFTLIGSANTLAAGKKLANKSPRGGLHVLVDQKTKKMWEALVVKTYKFTFHRSKKRF